MVTAPDSLYPLTLYYDSRCQLCSAEMHNLLRRDRAGLLRLADIWAPGFAGPPGNATFDELLTLIHARGADGQVLRGVEVFRRAYEAVGLGWVTAFTRWPVLGPLADRAYPVLARNRYRLPRWLVAPLFERAAQRAARQRCDADGRCNL